MRTYLLDILGKRRRRWLRSEEKLSKKLKNFGIKKITVDLINLNIEQMYDPELYPVDNEPKTPICVKTPPEHLEYELMVLSATNDISLLVDGKTMETMI